MSLDIRYDRGEFERVKRTLREMRERAQDVSPAWMALIQWFADEEFEQWLGRGKRWRQPWAPLAPSTVAEKFRAGLPLHPLIRTGKLVNSLTHRPLPIEHVTPSEVKAGTNVKYARYHQTGTRYMPQRILFSPAQIRKEQAATTAVFNWIVKGEQKVGGRTVMRGGR